MEYSDSEIFHDLVTPPKWDKAILSRWMQKNIQEGFKREFLVTVDRETIKCALKELTRIDGV